MQSTTLPVKKIVAGFVIIFSMAIALTILTRPSAKLVVVTDPSADIYISTERGGQYDKIGTGRATYSTRASSTEVFLMAQNNGRKTVSGAILERGKTVERKLDLTQSIDPLELSEGSVFSPHISGPLVQGIYPDDYLMTSYRIDSFATSRPAFAALPAMKKALWFDANNFIYTSYRDGVGRFLNGVPQYSAGMVSSITGNSSIQNISDSLRSSSTDIAMYPGKPLVIMAGNHLFTSTDMGSSLKAIVSFTLDNETGALFASNKYIYLTQTHLPSESATESLDTSGEKLDENTLIIQYDYKGREHSRITLPDEEAVGVGESGGNSFILTPSYLVSVERDQHNKTPIHFSYYGGMHTHKGSSVVLAGNGLWKVSFDGRSLQQLYSFGDEIGLKDSLATTNDGKLLFGTVAKPEAGTASGGRMFIADF